jgi:hyperosmotically inducible protein
MLLLGFLTAILGCASTPKQDPSAAQVGGDSAITTKVEQALFQELDLRTSIIHVRTDQGVVKLTGMVEKPPYVDTATEIASNVPGVVGVQETLFVMGP